MIGSSLEGAIALATTPELEADRRATGTEGPGLADLFIVSAVLEGGDGPAAGASDARASQTYPAVRLAFRKAQGRKCDRCWKVTPEADATGLCVRCRSVVGGAAA